MTIDLNPRDILRPGFSRIEDLRNDLKRYGHTLGLGVTARISEEVEISSEGVNDPTENLIILSQLLDEYVLAHQCDSMPIGKAADIVRRQAYSDSRFDLQRIFMIVTQQFNIIRLIQLGVAGIVNLLNINKFKTHGIYLVPIVRKCDEMRHAFYIAYNDKFIAICNRGAYVDEKFSGISLYELKDNSLRRLKRLRSMFGDYETLQSAEETINAELGSKVYSCDTREQKIGNCSFANAKSILKLILMMLGGDDDEYKNFTTWLRERELKSLLARFLLAKQKNDKIATKMYLELIDMYLAKIIRNLDKLEPAGEISKQRRLRSIKLIYPCIKDEDHLYSQVKLRRISRLIGELQDDQSIKKDILADHKTEIFQPRLNPKSLAMFVLNILAICFLVYFSPVIFLVFTTSFTGLVVLGSYLRRITNISNSACTSQAAGLPRNNTNIDYVNTNLDRVNALLLYSKIRGVGLDTHSCADAMQNLIVVSRPRPKIEI